MGAHNIETKLQKAGIGQIIDFSKGAPVNGAVGFAKGCLVIDYANGNWYRNTGTRDSATWVLHEQFLAANLAAAIAAETTANEDVFASGGIGEVKDASGNIIFLATTNTTPALAAGYAKGCILLQTETGTFKVNTGTAASCSFAEKVWSDPA